LKAPQKYWRLSSRIKHKSEKIKRTHSLTEVLDEISDVNMPFLFQILCSLLLHPVVGLPFTRQALAVSDRSDDLISGTDFLSLFIGASIPRSRAANSSRNLNKLVDSVTYRESYTEETAFATSPAPKDSHLSLARLHGDSPSSILPFNFHAGSKQDIVDEVYTESTGLSTTQTDDTSTLSNESQISPLPNAPFKDAVVRTVGVMPVDVNNEKTEYIPKFYSDKTINFGSDTEKDESSTYFTTSSSIVSFYDATTPSSFGLDSMATLPNNTTETVIFPDENSETTINNSSDMSEIPTEHNAFLANPISNKYDENIADLSSLDKIEDGAEDQTHKVVSVRVSSSFALGTAQQNNKLVQDTDRAAPGPLAGSVSLVTEEQPAATAIQRSQFSVEESAPSSVISVHEESSSSKVQSRLPAFPTTRATQSPLGQQSSPVSYRTSVSTATSGSRVNFYSESHSYRKAASSVAETVQRRVVAEQPQVQSNGHVSSAFKRVGVSSQKAQSNYQTNIPQINVNLNNQIRSHQFQGETSRVHKIYDTHQETPERNYELPEQIYGSPERIYATPEKNYEVDEAVSVMTNGRAHGVQSSAETTPADTSLRELNSQGEQPHDPNSKFGYVVEGRNFRKYQVEERTPDGFIVGEYGVVSHDDGSLRGVRYTADGTINPRLIYDALVKFLSL